MSEGGGRCGVAGRIRGEYLRASQHPCTPARTQAGQTPSQRVRQARSQARRMIHHDGIMGKGHQCVSPDVIRLGRASAIGTWSCWSCHTSQLLIRTTTKEAGRRLRLCFELIKGGNSHAASCSPRFHKHSRIIHLHSHPATCPSSGFT
jgi:hypothetical protein